jgi:hypothetical protein
LSAVHSVRDNFIRVELWIKGNDSQEKFNQLKQQYESNSKVELDSKLAWDSLEGKKACGIFLKKNNTDVNDRNDWPNQFQWLLNNLEKLDSYFRPKIKTL